MLIKLWFHLWLTGTESFHLNESIISLESYVKATAKKYRKVPSFIIKVLYNFKTIRKNAYYCSQEEVIFLNPKNKQ